MRKGLVATLGVVALILAVSPGFAVAPVISCVPDIIVSDAENNTQTDDVNLFVFSNALDLDEYVSDVDTSKSLLRWSFIETSPGNSIEINGIGSNTSGNVRDPGAFDIRAVDQFATIRNVLWSPSTGTLPFPDPGQASMQSTIELYVSDGTGTDSQSVIITTVNDSTAPYNDGDSGVDALQPKAEVSYGFDSGQEGWTWFDSAPDIEAPTHQWQGGSLQMTETATNVLVWGDWESPKDPAVASHPRFGCILRARYQLRSSVDGAACPGMRLRAITAHVENRTIPGTWINDFTNQDFNALTRTVYSTLDTMHIPGREPGTAGQTYTLLSWPEQVATLMSTDVVTYFTCDLLDMDTFDSDAGTLYLDEVDIDGIDRPEIGTGRAEAALSTTDFSSWTTNVGQIPGGTASLPTITADATGVTVTVARGDQYFDATAVSPGVPLEPGRYYRVVFYVTSTEDLTGDFGPTVRASVMSSKYVFESGKELSGGSLLAHFDSTPRGFEIWLVAPSADQGSTMTEPMQLKFESWLTSNNTGFPFNKNVSGTVRCTEVFVESFPAP